MKHEVWQNCYAHGWAEGELCSDAFLHPAKMAKGLVYRIVSEGLERGWWTKDAILIDPFGGIGSTGLACSAFGIRSVLVELEEKFVSLARQNFALHEKDWQAMGYPSPQIIQGDSRRLLELLQEVPMIIGSGITSPPYIDSTVEGTKGGRMGDGGPGKHWTTTVDNVEHHYGTTPGQLGAMPAGAITSPPYIDSHQATSTAGAGQAHVIEDWRTQTQDYGTTPGQLGAMKEGGGPIGAITSPPYEGSDPTMSHAQGTSRKDPKSKNFRPVAERDWAGRETPRPYSALTSPPYSATLGNQKSGIDWTKQKDAQKRKSPEKAHGYNGGGYGALTSPPYEGSAESGSRHGDSGIVGRLKAEGKTPSNFRYSEDGRSENLGNQRGETYWGACRLIYEQLYQLFSPGSHLAVVVKAFVRNKKIVDLPAMTLALLEDIGFEPVAWIDAKLTDEGVQSSAFPELMGEKQKKRMSFFRRLHEKKYPHLAIDEEVVLVMRKQ